MLFLCLIDEETELEGGETENDCIHSFHGCSFPKHPHFFSSEHELADGTGPSPLPSDVHRTEPTGRPLAEPRVESGFAHIQSL